MRHIRISCYAIPVLWALLSASASAETDCFSLLPGISTLNEYKFTPIEESDLTKVQYEKLRMLLEKITGLWKGEYRENICRGSESDPRIEQRKYRVYATTQISTEPGLLLSARLDSDESTKRVNFKLYLHKKELRYISDSPGNRVQVDKITDSDLSFIRKYIARSYADGVIIREEYTGISIRDGQLNISQRYYANGLLIGVNEWYLRK